jgi:hypothetical protein
VEALRAAAARGGARLVAQTLYPPGGEAAGAQTLTRALAATPARALVLLDGADATALTGALTSAGFSPTATKVLGLGGWGEQAPSGAFFNGAWFVTPPAVYAELDQRVQMDIGRPPLARERKVYDMMALSLLLSRGDNALTVAELTNWEGFAGQAGVFRFRADGRVERLYEVRQLDARGGSTVLDPAARRFAGAQP